MHVLCEQGVASPASFGGISRIRIRSPLGQSPPTVSFTARAAGDGEADTATVLGPGVEARSEADKIVDGMTFAQLCDEFECTSSPAVEQTARLIARDMLEGSKVLGIYALFVKYKDPLRSFSGRAAYKRNSWADGALRDKSVSIIRMAMLSTSVLKIEWILRGKPKLFALGVDRVVQKVTSTYTLNQISGQVVEHVEEWDLSGSTPQAKVYFWTTRLAYTAVQAGKDAGLLVDGLKKMLDKGDDSDAAFYYQDPSGDPRKFFVEDNFQSDFYQIGLLIALLYLAVQFLRLTL